MTPNVNYRLFLVFMMIAFVVNLTNYILFSEQKFRNSHSNNAFSSYAQDMVQNLNDNHEQVDLDVESSTISKTTTLKQRPQVAGAISPAQADTRTASTLNADEMDSCETSTNFIDDRDASCPDLPPDLGLMPPVEEVLTVASKSNYLQNVNPGGIYSPQNCKALQSVAIIVLSRDVKRPTPFFHYMHTFLIKQQLEYQIFVIEHLNKSAPFNRAVLYNIGFLESLRLRPDGMNCVMFVEAHLLPLDTRNLYRCGLYPRQLVTHVNKAPRTPYDHNFGGVIAMKRYQFQKINGFPNTLVEDPNAVYEGLLQRIEFVNLTVEITPDIVGKYRSLKNIYRNKTESPTTNKMTESLTIPAPTPTSLDDGLSNLAYQVVRTQHYKWFCRVTVSLPGDQAVQASAGDIVPVAIQI